MINDNKIEYDLQYKKVKNINLRVKPDCTVHVSANKRVPQRVIDEFVISKADFIIKALDKYANKAKEPKQQYFTEDELCVLITELCKRVYPHFEKKGVKYPTIKFKRMVSQWGNCHFTKGILTFNINLMFAPISCIEYVVAHEFTHFLQPNHSKRFYEELAEIMPDWKERRKKLNNIGR